MIGPVVHGPAMLSQIMLIGQAPGPREGSFGRPFAWTAGKTLFKWFEDAIGCTEEEFRAKVYIAAVARCFPGKASGGGDRRPDADEIESCRPFLEREAAILRPTLILPIGQLAIIEVLGESAKKRKLDDIVAKLERVSWHGQEVDVIPLPHPSGASPWHKVEPGRTLLEKALGLVRMHPTIREVFAR